MNKREVEKWIEHPLYKLAEFQLIKERKFIKFGKEKFVPPELVILKMVEIVNIAHKKKGQKEKLIKYIKENIKC